MRILIYEPESSGHRLHYVRHMVLAFQELPVDITVALRDDAREHSEFEAHLADVPVPVTWDTCIRPVRHGAMKAATDGVRALRESIARAKPDRLYVPYADGISQALGFERSLGLRTVPTSLRSEGLMMRGNFCYPQPSLKSRLAAKLSWIAATQAPWDIVHVLDPLVQRQVEGRCREADKRFHLIPDPVEANDSDDRRSARVTLNLPADGRYISCVGALDTRKGCDLLIGAFARANLPLSDRLLLVGKHHSSILQLLSSKPYAEMIQSGRIISIDRTVSTFEMLKVLEASDLIGALYAQHVGSVSLAIRAAAAHRPVLASDTGWLGYMVPRFDLGRITNVTDGVALSHTLKLALDESSTFTPSARNRRFVDYSTIDNFRAHWTAGLRSVLGLPAGPGMRSWAWLTEDSGPKNIGTR